DASDTGHFRQSFPVEFYRQVVRHLRRAGTTGAGIHQRERLVGGGHVDFLSVIGAVRRRPMSGNIPGTTAETKHPRGITLVPWRTQYGMDLLHSMAVFARVVEARSFTEAAKRLESTTSAVSKQIARLEADLGTRLLNRTTRRLSLTEAGQTFYEYCARILHE